MTYPFLELLIFFLSTLVQIFIFWSLFVATHQRNIESKYKLMKSNHEIKPKRYTLSLVCDTDVEKSCFFK